MHASYYQLRMQCPCQHGSCTRYTSRHTVHTHNKAFLPRSLIPSLHLRVCTNEQSLRRRNPELLALAAQTNQVQHACALRSTPNEISLPTSLIRHTVLMHDSTFLPRSLISSLHLRVYTNEQSQRRRNLGIRSVRAHQDQLEQVACMRATINSE